MKKIFIVTLLALSIGANARSIYVIPGGSGDKGGTAWDDACDSIQVAINSAIAGDIVKVKGSVTPGNTYLGSITIPSGVTVRGGYLGGPGSFDDTWNPSTYITKIVASSNSSAVTFSGSSYSSCIDGFTITGGTGTGSSIKYGGGIYIGTYAVPSIQHCVIENNSADFGGGIYAPYGSYPSVSYCTIQHNTFKLLNGDSGAGIYWYGGSCTYSTIHGNGTNSVQSANGAGVYYGGYSSGNYSFTNNTVDRNGSSSVTYGGGLYITGCPSSLTISGNTFSVNAASTGGGVYLSAPSSVVGNTFSENSAVTGGGIYVSSVTGVTRNTFTSNASTGAGAAAYLACSSSTPSSFYDNMLVGNASSGASGSNGAICANIPQSTTLISNNTIINGSGGGILLRYTNPGQPVATVQNNIIYGCGAFGVGRSGYPISWYSYKNWIRNVTSTYLGTPTSNTDYTNDYQLNTVFVNNSNGNYHLKSDSPLIDRGLDTGVPAGSTDIDGETRLVDMPYIVTGASVDIGADEVQLPMFQISNLVVDPTVCKEGDQPNISFTSSRPLSLCTVTVNGHSATNVTWISDIPNKHEDCSCTYTVMSNDHSGFATILITATDQQSNTTSLTSNDMLWITKPYKYEVHQGQNTRVVTNANGTSAFYTYDERYRLRQVKNKKSDSSNISGAVVNYTVDGAGNRAQIWFDEDSAAKKHLFDYDAINRLTNANYYSTSGIQDASFVFDWAGNITSFAGSALNYDAADRLLLDGDLKYFGSGSLSEVWSSGSRTRHYIYDSRELLTEVDYN